MIVCGRLTRQQRIYKQFPNIKVRELRLSQTDLNTKRMLDLMAVTTSGGAMPLYLHVANRILRDMRILQQQTGSGFNYADFKLRLEEEQLTKEQLAPLKQRLDTLESFMVEDHAKAYDMFARERRGISSKKSKATKSKGTDWTPSVGRPSHLTAHVANPTLAVRPAHHRGLIVPVRYG